MFSREGRIITNKFGEFQNSYKSFDSHESLQEELKTYRIKFEDTDDEEDNDPNSNQLTLKLASPQKENKRQKLLEHPLYGHLTKAKLKENLDCKF